MIVDLREADFSYDKFIAAAKALAQQYDSMIRYVTIGRSHDNRDIVLLKIGTGKKYIVCCGGVHARETINPVVLLGIAEYYAELYGSYKQKKRDLILRLYGTDQHLKEEYEQMLYGACIYELLQAFTILMVPLLNPDGYMIATEGFQAIRDEKLRSRCEAMGPAGSEWKANARGVDLNRNFPCHLWKPKFEGDQPASENETRALIRLFHDHKTRGFLDFHSRGKSIYYHRIMMPDSYNEKQLAIASRLQKLINYELESPEDEVESGDSGGNTVHYYSERFWKPALTIETVAEDAEFPLEVGHRAPAFEELRFLIPEFGSMVV